MTKANGTQTNGSEEALFRPGRWSEEYPDLGTEPLPAEVFTSKEQFELEREHIFKKVWLNVGRVEQIPEVGDYFVKEITMCNASIIVVRGKDGEVRAFHNICTHRGNKIAWDQGGNAKAFTCKFHAWSFGLDGELRNVPDEEDFFGLNKCDKGLASVSCDEWEGFIFINMDPSPEESLKEYLGDMVSKFRGYPFAELSASPRAWETDINANWKLAKDAFQENYHIKVVHKRTGAGAMVSDTNPFSHWLDVRLFARHAVGSVEGYPPKRKSASTSSSVRRLAGKVGVLPFSSANKDGDKTAGLQGVNPGGHKSWITDLNCIFPCFLIIASEGSYFVHNFWPVDVDKTRWELTQYLPKAQDIGQAWAQECSHVLIRDVALEDGSTLEHTQAALASGAIKEVVLKDAECIVRHGHNVVDQMIKGQPLQSPATQEGKDNA